MKPVFQSFVAVLALVPLALADTWGPAYSLGPATAAVIGTSTTYIPGTPPTNAQDALFLWIGISNATSGLSQSGSASCRNAFGTDAGYSCGASATQWCLSASYFGPVFPLTDGPYIAVNGSTQIGINYSVSFLLTGDNSGLTLFIAERYDGPLIHGGWGTGTEYQGTCTTASPGNGN
ncbi:hypothetical protein C8J56DRAFT_769422 [Mycena floridula]|nr:hypothetical protein C8J56DRAFT_769422 [Mycena floridula]